MPSVQPARRYRFGIFEADAVTGELRRKGMRIRLHAQPFQLLLLLLERPAELVTREEIVRALWPQGTFVDYEHGINSAIARLRDALGDTAGNSRYIETLARRGYRFIAPVEASGDQASPAAPQAPDPGTQAASNQSPLSPEPSSSGIVSRVLASADELPRASYPIVQTLFLLLQLMYLGFYIGALANLSEIDELFSRLPHSTHAFMVLIVTAAILIPVRAFTLSTALMHAPASRSNFLRLWPFLLAFDVLWALAPFLLLHHINFGLALACAALLVYSPFAQRSLVLMGAGQPPASNLS